uniref:Uncharacterized protein n=1 Tax=Iridovirus sp. TaxID=135728 RepID=A0AAU7YC43_9VIRU
MMLFSYLHIQLLQHVYPEDSYLYHLHLLQKNYPPYLNYHT